MKEDLDFAYVRVANRIRHQVLQREYEVGVALPRQRDLAAQNNVAYATLKKALDILEREGYVVRRNGMGTYASLPEWWMPKALVVDDEPVIRRLLSTVLVSRGWQCVAVESGEEALKRFREDSFELIFLDLIMPGMNGAQTFRQIRIDDPSARVVIITAYPDSDLMSQAMAVGPFAIMRKPFDLDQIKIVLGHAARGVRHYEEVP